MNVIEENDEKPICTPNSYFLAIPVDLRVGTNIQNFKLTCIDLDSSPRSFRYSIGSGTPFPWVLVLVALAAVEGEGGLCSHTDLGTACAGGDILNKGSRDEDHHGPVSPTPHSGFPVSPNSSQAPIHGCPKPQGRVNLIGGTPALYNSQPIMIRESY